MRRKTKFGLDMYCLLPLHIACNSKYETTERFITLSMPWKENNSKYSNCSRNGPYPEMYIVFAFRMEGQVELNVKDKI